MDSFFLRLRALPARDRGPDRGPGERRRARPRALGAALGLALIGGARAGPARAFLASDPVAQAAEVTPAPPAQDAAQDAERAALQADPRSPELDRAWLDAALTGLDAFEPASDSADELGARIAVALRAVERAGSLVHARWVAQTAEFLARETSAPLRAVPAVERLLERDDLPPAERAGVQVHLGALFLEGGAPAESLAICERLTPSLGDADAALGLQFLRLRVASELRLGLLDLAARSVAAEERAAQRQGTPDERAIAAIHRFQLRAAAEDFETALRGIEAELARPADPALAPWIRPNLEYLAGQAHSELARGRGDSAPAREHFARVLADPNARPQDQLAVHLWRADLELRAGQGERAALDLAAAERLLEARGGVGTLDSRALHAALSAWRSTEWPADGAERARDRARLRAVLEEFLAARARTTVRAGGENRLLYGDWRLVLSELLRAELDEGPVATRAERALQVLLDEQHTRAGARAGARPGVQEVLASLAKPGRGVLVLFPSMQRSHAFAWDPDGGVTHHGLPRRDELRAVTQDLVGDLLLAPWKDSERAGREERLERARGAFGAAFLAEDLAQRVAGWNEVLVVGAELVLAAPLELARLPDGRELGQVLGVSYCPSLPLAQRLAAAAAPVGSARILVAAATRPSPEALRLQADLAPIPLGQRDLDRWRRAAAPWAIEEAGARAATPEGLRQFAAGTWSLWLVLAHGVYDPSEEFPAGLALERGILRLADIVGETRRWPAEVLLLACGSARGVARFGDDTATHLGTSFLQGGARCVLVSRGELELAATSSFLEALLQARVRGQDLGQATAAGRRALAADPRTRDPFYRGLIALHGVIPAPSLAEPGPHDESSGVPRNAPAAGEASAGLGLGAAWAWTAAFVLLVLLALLALARARAR